MRFAYPGYKSETLAVLLLRWESVESPWIPAFAGMTIKNATATAGSYSRNRNRNRNRNYNYSYSYSHS